MANKAWVPNTDGDWSVGSNWTGGTVPGSSDDVTINTAQKHTISYSSGATATIHSLALGNDVLAIGSGGLTVTQGGITGSGVVTVGSGATFTLSASASASANTATFGSSAGQIALTSGTGSDSFGFAVGALKSTDTVNGGGGAAIDTIRFTTAGTVAASAFTGVSHIEALSLDALGNNVTLSNALASSSDIASVFYVYGAGGNDTVNASAVTTTKILITAGAGIDSLTGGGGADTFYFSPADLTSADSVNGGGGSAVDRVVLTTPGTVAAGAFANVSHIEQLFLANGTNNVGLNDAMVASSDNSHILSVVGGAGDDTVNASAVTTAANRVYFTAGAGNDALTGGNGLDIFYFTASNLTLGDSVNGGTGTAPDILAFTTAGLVAASAFTNVSHIEQITLANANGSNLILTDALVGSSDIGHILTVVGGSGNDTVNASNVTTPTDKVDFIAGAGNDTLTGGLGADNFYFGDAALTAADTVNGGTGSAIDTIVFTNTLSSVSFQNVSHIEQIVLTQGTSSFPQAIDIPDALVSSADDNGVLYVTAGAGGSDIDASGVTTPTNRIFFTVSYAASFNVLNGGAGNDTFYLPLGSYAAEDQFFGNGGTADRVVFTQAGNIDTSDALIHVFSIEQIYLANGTNEITLPDTMVGSSNTHTVTVFGGTGADQIDGSGVFSAGNSVRLFGGGGADSLFASTGNDVFGYTAVSDSTSGHYDVFHSFNPAADKIDLPSGFTVAGVSNVASGTVNTASFDADMSAAIGGALTSHEAVTFHVTGGDLNNTVFLVVNPTGTAGYVSGADYVFDITGSSGTYTPATFI